MTDRVYPQRAQAYQVIRPADGLGDEDSQIRVAKQSGDGCIAFEWARRGCACHLAREERLREVERADLDALQEGPVGRRARWVCVTHPHVVGDLTVYTKQRTSYSTVTYGRLVCML